MGQVIYEVAPAKLRGLLEWLTEAGAAVLAAAPVDSKGKFLDDGIWARDDEAAFGIPVRVVTVDLRSLPNLQLEFEHAVLRVVAEPAIRLGDEGWYVTHWTVTKVARLVELLHEIYARVAGVVPGLDVEMPQTIDDWCCHHSCHAVQPDCSSVADAISWTGDRYPDFDEEDEEA